MGSQQIIHIRQVPFKLIETKIIVCRLAGLSLKDTGNCICCSPNTVKTYLSNIYIKLEVRNVAQLINTALHAGFDNTGCYRGTPVLSPHELERLHLIKKRP